jgi:hypothetical protein
MSPLNSSIGSKQGLYNQLFRQVLPILSRQSRDATTEWILDLNRLLFHQLSNEMSIETIGKLN